MRRIIVRGVVAAAVFAASAVVMTAMAPETSAAPPNRCEQQCYRDYHQCVPICSKNPCFVSCETVLEICLSNCGSES